MKNNLLIKDTNLWPSGPREWSVLVNKRKIMRRLDSITENQGFGLPELLSKSPINWRITVESETASLLSINAQDVFNTFTKEQLYGMMEFDSWIKFPDDSEIICKVISEMNEEKKRKYTLKIFKRDLRKLVKERNFKF